MSEFVEEVELSGVVSEGSGEGSTPASRKLVEDKKVRIRELAEWDQLDRQQRRALGLPLTDTEWAKVKGLNPRRVGKYRVDPFYERCVEELRSVTAKRISGGGSAVLANVALSNVPGSDDVADYAAIKSQLAGLARQGDSRALEIWLKHWGKPFLDEEVSSRVSDLASFSDEALVELVVGIVAPVLLADVLVSAGWKVSAPGVRVVDGDGDV